MRYGLGAGWKQYTCIMKVKFQGKNREKVQRQEQRLLEVLAIPAPTLFWHPSISLERLISDFAEHQDSIIVT